MGVIFGIALMAGWQHMMRHRSTKRVAKVVKSSLLRLLGCFFLEFPQLILLKLVLLILVHYVGLFLLIIFL